MNVAEMTIEQKDAKALEIARAIIDRPKSFPKPTGFDKYDARETDVVVTTLPKSGTTLTSQLAYQTVIATGGACDKDPDGMSFDDICEVTPWVDFGPDLGFVDFESNPRIFKSHSTPTLFKETIQKHIVVLRNPVSYPASALDFLFEEWGDKDLKDVYVLEKIYHEFLAVRLLGLGEGFGFPFDNDDVAHKDEKKDGEAKVPVGPWFLHAKSWLENMRPNTLFMFYEDIVKDMGGSAQRIAKFIGRELSEEGEKQVVARCDRTYMSTDPKFKCTLENKALGFGANAWKAKPKTDGGFKRFKPVPEELEQLRIRFKQEFGVDTYVGFQDVVRAKQRELGIDF